MNDIWNIILHEEKNNKISIPINNPKKSGRYLCTCVSFRHGKEINRYLQIMTFNYEKNHWHDCNTPGGISHNILAWTDKIEPCDFTNYNYQIGGYFMKK